MEIILCVTANQLPILGKGNIALQDASPHLGGRNIGFKRVFRELQRRTPMADGEIRRTDFVGAAGLEPVFQAPLIHVFHQPERARPQMDFAFTPVMPVLQIRPLVVPFFKAWRSPTILLAMPIRCRMGGRE